MNRRRGFTLIELLVVIAIIAILAAILFPVFAQAREAARTTSCLSNVKQLSLGALMYVQDYDERFWAWNWGFFCNGGNNGAPRDSSAFWTVAIYPYVKNKQIYQCPDDILQWDDAYANNAGQNCSDDGGAHDPFAPFSPTAFYWDTWDNTWNPNHVSYAVNEMLDGSAKLARIRTPANYMLMADAVPQLADVWNDTWPSSWARPDAISARVAFSANQDGCCIMWGAPGWNIAQQNATYYQQHYANGYLENSTRHHGGENIAYVDGHAKYLRWMNATWLNLTTGTIQ